MYCCNISTLKGSSLKRVDKFTYLRSSVSSTEKHIKKRLAKAWTAIDSADIPDPLLLPSLSSIASGRLPGLHLLSAQGCCIKVQAGRSAFARPCERVHRGTSLMSSSLLLQQCSACLVRLTLRVFVMGGWWP